MSRFLILFISVLTLASCYRMPTEDDCTTIPMTNNPEVTREKAGGLQPTMGF